jgi:hypothetical protein
VHRRIPVTYAELHRQYLKDAHPQMYRAMTADGSLKQRLDAKARDALEMSELVERQMMAAKAPENETPAARMARFAEIPLIVHEIVMNEVVYAL